MSESAARKVKIYDEGRRPVEMTPDEMADLAGGVFPLSSRVPEAEGEAFDWADWYDAWREREAIDGSVRPTHLKVEAADGFQAVIPWEQLREAAVLVRKNGAPLVKDAPVRLYVPNGTSACLNVKSVAALRIAREPERHAEAEYGFKNTFSPEELRKP